MLWTREEDTQARLLRPASLIRMRAALDTRAIRSLVIRRRVDAIFETLARCRSNGPFAPADGVDPQAVASLHRPAAPHPEREIEYAQRTAHVPVGFWRTVGHSQNSFVPVFHGRAREAWRARTLRIPPCAARKSPERFGILEPRRKAAGWGQLFRPAFPGHRPDEATAATRRPWPSSRSNANGEVDIKRLVLASTRATR